MTQGKLITVTRKDLNPSYQAVQSAHAAIKFQHDYPSISKEWNEKSQYLIMLSVSSMNDLDHLMEKLRKKNILFSIFKEPDLNNEITAIALEPTKLSQKICSNIPLMFKEYTSIWNN